MPLEAPMKLPSHDRYDYVPINRPPEIEL